jgi:ribonucleoside-diphosphate reductase alpha chain
MESSSTYTLEEREFFRNLIKEKHGMDLEKEILSDITVHMKYARYLEDKQRRENWNELVTRNMEMHIKKFPHIEEEIRQNYKMVFDKKVLPSMRSMQFGGKPIEVSPNRVFNCAFAPADDPRVFGEIMFLLLGGTGVGYSVQRHHVNNLPEIHRPSTKRTRRFLIGDSIEGWADSVKALVMSYFKGTSKLRFDFSDIRPKGARLVTSGGKAPGPQPLRECLVKVEGILDAKENGDKLTPIEVHDIICHIADAVLAGGIRRAALISLFSADDEDMLSAKAGAWWELNPQRGRANNSVVIMRHRIDEPTFKNIWKRVEESRSGEPGFYFSNDKEWGCNPCCEIGLRPFQFCNLTEINVSNVNSQRELEKRAKAASFIGTLQASYTDFHYLRPIWQRTTEKDSLIGVSMTGIASGEVLKLDLEEAAEQVKFENKRVAKLIGIRPAARTTSVKPAGTTSLTLGTSSGIHAWHNDYYIRRLRVGKNEAIYSYLVNNLPDLVEDCRFRPHDTAILSVPQKAPEGAITRHETALDLLERVKKVSNEWIKPGHINGNNTHNVSATITIKDDEWETVGDWMWINRNVYNGLSVLPYDGGTYVQAPFEDCDKETYERMLELVKNVNLDLITEVTDETDLSGEIACGGGSCEIF